LSSDKEKSAIEGLKHACYQENEWRKDTSDPKHIMTCIGCLYHNSLNAKIPAEDTLLAKQEGNTTSIATPIYRILTMVVYKIKEYAQSINISLK